MPDNTQVARQAFEDLFGKGKLDVVDRCYDASFQGHETLVEDYDCDELKENAQRYRQAFPDLAVRVEEAIGAGEKVLLRWSARGTHQGPFLGKAPTGKAITTDGLTVMTFRNGKIVEEWTQWNALALIQTLGMAPQLQQGASPP
jgi:steroid delta-isomerase-like uncharacterized protein